MTKKKINIDLKSLDKKERLKIRKEAYKTWALSQESARNKKQSYQAVVSKTGLSIDQVEKLYEKDNWESRYNKDIESGKFDRLAEKEREKAIKNITKHSDNEELADTIEELLANSGLNERQKLFICYYLQNFNGVQAALNAGYSKHSANNESSRILNTPSIKRMLSKASNIMSRDVSLSAKQLIEEYIRIGFADMTDFVQFNGSRVKLKDSNKIDGRLITEVKQGRDGITVKLVDKKWALDKLEKLLELLPDKKLELETKKYELQKRLVEKQLQENNPDSEDDNTIIINFN